MANVKALLIPARGGQPHYVEFDDDQIEPLQTIVGGQFEFFRLEEPPGLVLICNADGAVSKPANFFFGEHIFYGDILIANYDGTEHLQSITNEDVLRLKFINGFLRIRPKT